MLEDQPIRHEAAYLRSLSMKDETADLGGLANAAIARISSTGVGCLLDE